MAHQYRRITEAVSAEQWRRTGDLAGDKPLINGEGRIVRAYSRADVDPASKCVHCGSTMKAHGWIEPPAPPSTLVASDRVNPTTGEVVAAPLPAAPPKFPVVFVKAPKGTETFPDRNVVNEAEEKQALADGYTAKVVVVPAPAPAPKPVAEPVVLSKYPQTFYKLPKGTETFPDRTVVDDAEDKQARADGYAPKVVTVAGVKAHAAPPTEPIVVERGDLEGLAVCPGDWVITHPTGERETCKPDRFPNEWARIGLF